MKPLGYPVCRSRKYVTEEAVYNQVASREWSDGLLPVDYISDTGFDVYAQLLRSVT